MWSIQHSFRRKFIFAKYLFIERVTLAGSVHSTTHYRKYLVVTKCESFGISLSLSLSFSNPFAQLFVSSRARFTSCSHHVRSSLLHIRYIHFHFVFLNKFALLYFCAANLSSLSRLWIFQMYICDVGKYLWLISNNLVNALVCRDMLSHHHSCLKHMENVCTDFRM